MARGGSKALFVRMLVVTALIAWAAFAALPALAEGAVALAQPQDIFQSGWAIGVSWDYRSRAEAERVALQDCRTAHEASEETRKLCRIVANFRGQCAAVARVVLTDSADDEDSGFGWALGQGKAAARVDAIAKCAAIAGEKTIKLGPPGPGPASQGTSVPGQGTSPRSPSGASSDGRNAGPRTITQSRGQFCKVTIEGCDGRAR